MSSKKVFRKMETEDTKKRELGISGANNGERFLEYLIRTGNNEDNREAASILPNKLNLYIYIYIWMAEERRDCLLLNRIKSCGESESLTS